MYAKQKYLVHKKVQGQHFKQVVVTKHFDISQGQEVILSKINSLMTYNSLQHIVTSMIGFVTLPPFLYLEYCKGSQVTKPIILVKICYVCHSRIGQSAFV